MALPSSECIVPTLYSLQLLKLPHRCKLELCKPARTGRIYSTSRSRCVLRTSCVNTWPLTSSVAWSWQYCPKSLTSLVETDALAVCAGVDAAAVCAGAGAELPLDARPAVHC